jgi:hypothetical protein
MEDDLKRAEEWRAERKKYLDTFLSYENESKK